MMEDKRDLLLLRFRLMMLSKDQKSKVMKDLRKIMIQEIETNWIDLDQITDSRIYHALNKLLIDKQGETAVYDYLRQIEKAATVDRSSRSDT